MIILESITKETGSTFVSSVYCQVDRHKYILAEVLTGRSKIDSDLTAVLGT